MQAGYGPFPFEVELIVMHPFDLLLTRQEQLMHEQGLQVIEVEIDRPLFLQGRIPFSHIPFVHPVHDLHTVGSQLHPEDFNPQERLDRQLEGTVFDQLEFHPRADRFILHLEIDVQTRRERPESRFVLLHRRHKRFQLLGIDFLLVARYLRRLTPVETQEGNQQEAGQDHSVYSSHLLSVSSI